MSRNSRRHRVPVYRRPIFIVGVILLLALIAVGIFLYWHGNNRVVSPDSATSSTAPSVPSSDDDSNQEEPDAPAGITQFEGGDPNKKSELSGRIAYHNINTSRQVLTVMISVDQYLNSGGECILSLERDGRSVYTTTRSIVADVTTSFCGPFEAPLANLSSGTYNLKVHLSADGKTGEIETNINI